MSNEVTDWLEQSGLGEFVEVFQSHYLADFAVLAETSDDELKEIGLPLGVRKLLRREIESRQAGVADAGVATPEGLPTAPLQVTEVHEVYEAAPVEDANEAPPPPVPPPVPHEGLYHFPEPGAFPTQPASTLETVIRPIVDPATLPHVEALESSLPEPQPLEFTPEEELMSTRRNILVAPVPDEAPAVYDYSAPDEGLVGSRVGPDAIQVVDQGPDEEGYFVAPLQVSTARNREENRRSRAAVAVRDRTISIVVTILAHVALFFLIGLIIVTQPKVRPPEVIASTAPVSTEVIQKPKVVSQHRPQPSASSLPTPNLLSSRSLSPMTVPTVDIEVTDSLIDLGTSFGAGVSFGSGAAGAGTFFGTPTTGRLAVVFDITNSMYAATPVVIEEINRNFSDSQVVSVFGGSFKREASEIIPYRGNKPIHNIVQQFSAGAATDAVIDALYSLERCDSLEVKSGVLTGRQSVGAAIVSLLEEGAAPKTIFVFSDFEDGVDPDFMEEVGTLVRRRNVKVVFWYPFDNPRPKWNAVRQCYEEFVENTRGELKEETIQAE